MGKDGKKQRKKTSATTTTPSSGGAAAGTTEFIGFSAFADDAAAITGADDGDYGEGNKSPSSTKQSQNSANSIRLHAQWAPVYTGQSQELRALFPRLVSKRDAVTKAKALQDLAAFFSGDSEDNGSNVSKKVQAEALIHYGWLFRHGASGNCYDASPQVRAAAVAVWAAARSRLPKAFRNVVVAEPQLAGMFAIGRCDPAADVRQQSEQLCSAVAEEEEEEQYAGGSDNDSSMSATWNDGIWEYANRVFAWGRPSAFYEDVVMFGRGRGGGTGGGGGKGSGGNKTSWMELNDHHRDSYEETFERVVGMALQLMELWVRENCSSTIAAGDDAVGRLLPSKTQADIRAHVAQLWKTLKSSKASLRRKTYQLLLTTVTLRPDWVFDSDSEEGGMVATTLPQVLLSEKDGANLPALLETVVTVLVAYQKRHPSSNYDPTGAYQKPISKLLKKACFGARVESWGPTLLPLIAIFPDAAPLLRAAWDGRTLSLGQDKWRLMSAVVECASFALLRRQKQEDQHSERGAPNAQAIAEIWLDMWREALAEPPPLVDQRSSAPGTAKYSAALAQLLRELARSLSQFQQATRSQRSNCAWDDVDKWFWDAGLRLVPDAQSASKKYQPRAIVVVLRELQLEKHHSEDGSPNFVIPCICDFVRNDMQQYQESSGFVPSEESYQLYEEALAYCGPTVVFEKLETFVMNDLLRWMVVHTSALSSQPQSRTYLRHDFCLLSCALGALPDKRSSLWEIVLREVIKAQCRLDWLSEGLRFLLEVKDAIHWVRCLSLDQFALDVGFGRFPDHSTCGMEGEQDSEGRLGFLRLCLGLHPGGLSELLVSRSVLSDFIESECSAIDADAEEEQDLVSSSLLVALSELLRTNKSLLELDQLDRIVFESWYRGGQLFVEETLTVLKQDKPLGLRFVSNASENVRQQLFGSILKSDNEGVIANWASRASRLLRVCRCFETEDINLQPSLTLVGLASTDAWKSSPRTLFGCTLSLLAHESSTADKCALLLNEGEAATELAVMILLSISEAATDAAKAARTKDHHDSCAVFLDAIGAKAMGSFVEEVIHSLVKVMTDALEMQKADDSGLVCRGVAVLSQLIAVLFEPIASPTSVKLDPTTVAEGSWLWYVTNPENDDARELVEVAKVHFDSQTGYYFTIRFNRAHGETQERQTVVERLRKDETDNSQRRILSESIPEDERMRRDNMRDLIFEQLISRYLTSNHWTTMIAELVSVVACVIGLGPERGAGSIRYEIFRMLKSAEDRFLSSLNDGNIQDATSALWTLSLALGYGFNTTPSGWVFAELPIDPIPTYLSILAAFDQEGGIIDTRLNDAILAWFSTSLMYAIMSRDARDDEESPVAPSLQLMFKIISRSFQIENKSGFSGNHLIATRAILEGLRMISGSSVSKGYQEESAAKSISKDLVMAFACTWEDDERLVHGPLCLATPDWRRHSSFAEIMGLVQTSSTVRDIILAANDPECCEALSQALFSASKRYYALQLLDAFASTGDPIFDGIELEADTKRRLKDWTRGFEDEEAEEIEEDVEIVGQWLPRRMMSEIEEWGENIIEETEEAKTIGRLLTWICVLKVLDVVAPRDFRYRPAFVSFLSQCGAANAALNIAVLHDASINSTSKVAIAPTLQHIDDLFRDGSLLDISNLSSLVLFQTVEVTPSLSRRWWEEYCPKVYINDFQSFVERHIAPEILKRELDRIRDDDFGDMSVKSSSVSREVTATYDQDDFALQVRIEVPHAFPLRSAWVDCSRTLGVPPERWKRWQLQIKQMLNNQGGTLRDALLLWKDNVDKEFAGVEPCPVCYSVLHVKTHKLPSLQCKTCANCFHFDCLTQWFRSSGKNQCVLCQQPWQGSRV